MRVEVIKVEVIGVLSRGSGVVVLLEELVCKVETLLEVCLSTLYVALLALALLTANRRIDVVAQCLQTLVERINLTLAADVLLVRRAVLVEEHNIQLVTLQLREELVGHIVVVHTEVELTQRHIVVAVELGEYLAQHHTLVHPRNQAVRVIRRTSEGGHIVNLLVALTLSYHLAQILRCSLVFVATHLLRVMDTTRVERGVKVLGRILSELIVVTQLVQRVTLDELKLEVQVVVETVRCNRCLVDGEALLVHLEGCCHMLCVLHADVRHVTDKYTTLQGHLLLIALVERRKLRAHLLG